MGYINKSKLQNKSNLWRKRAGVSYHTILTVSFVALRFEFLFHVMLTKQFLCNLCKSCLTLDVYRDPLGFCPW